tara:strand:- start:4 stop:384 length:381 start_codon:yes stop_codon:yes gene_type:complete
MKVITENNVQILELEASIFNTLTKTERDELMVLYECKDVQKSGDESTTRSADHITPEMYDYRNGMLQQFNKNTSGTKFMVGHDGFKYVPQLTFRKIGSKKATQDELLMKENLHMVKHPDKMDKTTK